MCLKGFEPRTQDHDWHKFKGVPSVSLHNEIPSSINESFFRGQVYVTVKDAIFQASTPLRHIVEREKALSQSNVDLKPIQCFYSDGGPDHNPRNFSVKIA